MGGREGAIELIFRLIKANGDFLIIGSVGKYSDNTTSDTPLHPYSLSIKVIIQALTPGSPNHFGAPLPILGEALGRRPPRLRLSSPLSQNWERGEDPDRHFTGSR